MSRRKHVLQKCLQEHVDPPVEGQHIVRAVGSRGSNMIEVEFPDGTKTLSLLPAKFHKKLWIKRGNFLIIENIEGAETAVTGQILHVLFNDDVKNLKKMEGVWPPEFNSAPAPAPAASVDAGSGDLTAALDNLSIEQRHGNDGNNNSSADPSHEGSEIERKAEEEAGIESSYSSSDDGLPPLAARIQNRKVIEYTISESDSD